MCDSFSLARREFFFDRSPRIFENILGLYRKGELHLTESVCPRDFLGELDYWGLSSLYLEPCCAYTLQRASWLLPLMDQGVDQEDEVNPFQGMCCSKLRNFIWKLFEDPNSSTAAKVTHRHLNVFFPNYLISVNFCTIERSYKSKDWILGNQETTQSQWMFSITRLFVVV